MKILIIFFARFTKLTYSKDIVKKIGEFCILENDNAILFNRSCPALGPGCPRESFLAEFPGGRRSWTNFYGCRNTHFCRHMKILE